MRTFVLSLTVLLALSAAASPAQAQTTHTAPQSAIDAALQQHATAADADRDTVRRLLARPEVRELAGGMGLDLRRASDAVGTLEGQDLAAVAAQARQAESTLAGGQSVTISTTLIIIGLLVLILIIVAVN